MSDKDPFLSRWSRRKTEAREKGEVIPEPREAEAQSPAPAEARPPEPLPPVESLTPDSDFRPFMRPEVDEGMKRQALKTLFRDERFNVMDGLDTYIDDYSKPDPIPESWLSQLNQMARLGDYREPPAEPVAGDAAERVPGIAGDSPGDPQNGEPNQEVAEKPSSSSSDTASSQIPPPAVKE